MRIEFLTEWGVYVAGQVVAVGTHRELLRDVPAYRQVVTREEEVSA